MSTTLDQACDRLIGAYDRLAEWAAGQAEPGPLDAMAERIEGLLAGPADPSVSPCLRGEKAPRRLACLSQRAGGGADLSTCSISELLAAVTGVGLVIGDIAGRLDLAEDDANDVAWAAARLRTLVGELRTRLGAQPGNDRPAAARTLRNPATGQPKRRGGPR